MDEKLVKAAQKEMRRKAPEDDSKRDAKRQKKAAEEGEDDFARYDYDAAKDLLQSVRGYLINCPFRREKSATKEASDLLAAAAASLGCPRPALAPVRLSVSGAVFLRETSSSSAAAAAAAATAAATTDAEASGGGAEAAKPGEPRGPTALVKEVLSLLDDGKHKRPEFCNKMVPVEATCALDAAAISAAAEACARPALARRAAEAAAAAAAAPAAEAAAAAEAPEVKFAVGYRCKANESARQMTIKAAAEGFERACKAEGLKPKVNLTDPEVALLVEAVPIGHGTAAPVAAKPAAPAAGGGGEKDADASAPAAAAAGAAAATPGGTTGPAVVVCMCVADKSMLAFKPRLGLRQLIISA